MSCVCRCANSVLTKARVVARSATARQNSLTNRSGRAHIWQTKCHRQTNLRSILEQLPRSGQISASSEETKSSQSKRLFIRIPIFQCPIRGDVKKKSSPSSPRGRRMLCLHPAQSQFRRGCGLAAYSGQTKQLAVCTRRFHDAMVIRRLRFWKLRKQPRWLSWANHGPI